MFIGGWMYWDAESQNWRPRTAIITDASLEAFDRLPNREAICRPCTESAHAECEGALLCKCPCRDELSVEFLVHELEQDWEERDRDKQRPE
jgi:hypothetical protein